MAQKSHQLGMRSLEISAGTAIGPYHVQGGLPNQDAHDFILLDGMAVLAVADGAGSLERSDEGSEFAVEVAAGMAADLLIAAARAEEKPNLQSILAQSIREARAAVLTLDYWKQAGSTLVLAVLTQEEFAVGALGDSFAVVHSTDGKLHLIQPPAAGEYANITKLLTSDDPTVSICSGPLSSIDALALCSDAFEHSTLEQRVPTQGFWDRVFAMGAQGRLSVNELIDYMEGQGKIDDDATMVVASLKEAPREDAELLFEDLDLMELSKLADGEPEAEEANFSGPPKGIPTSF